MSTVLGCIADDFTGATDLAGLLARSGHRVSLRMGVPDTAPDLDEVAAFEVIALKCRTSPVNEAVDETQAALDWLKAAGATRFFWKYCSTFDSTPEGNIGPVAENLMAVLDTEQTIYCPAFPENGRSIFMGNLFVGQQPLAESPMKDHPLTPMRDSNLARLLAPQVKGKTGLIDRLTVARGPEAIRAALADLKTDGIAHVIIDAVADEDLHLIAEACSHMPLMTGGSAVAMPLPDIFAREGALSQSTTPTRADIGAGAVVLSGSCSAMTRAQVALYCENAPSLRLDPLVLHETGNSVAKSWLAAQDFSTAPLIYATAEPDAVRAAQEVLGRERAGAIIEEALAELAVIARENGARRFVIAGGETSGAVTQALGVTRLDIGPEIAAGVPWTFAQSDSKQVALALKSGNFGKESFFNDALTLISSYLEAP